MPDAKGHIRGVTVPRVPWHEQRSKYPLLPYQYEIVFACLRPLTAHDISCTYRWRGQTAQAIAARARPLVKRGWLDRSETGIYTASRFAREVMYR